MPESIVLHPHLPPYQIVLLRPDLNRPWRIRCWTPDEVREALDAWPSARVLSLTLDGEDVAKEFGVVAS